MGAKRDGPKRKKENEKTEMEVLRAALYQRQTDDSRIWKVQLSKVKMELQPMSIDIVDDFVPKKGRLIPLLEEENKK